MEIRNAVPDERYVEGRKMLPGVVGGDDEGYGVDAFGALRADRARKECEVLNGDEAEDV